MNTPLTSNKTSATPGGETQSTSRPAWVVANIRTRICDRCHWPYDEDAFFNLGTSGPRRAGEQYTDRPKRRNVCAGCEQTTGDTKKNERRSLTKAGSTISFHAGRCDFPRAEFIRRYDWDLHRMAHDIDHAYENTCCYCWQPYAGMDGGLSVVTIDIVDPDAEPYYRTNTRWCCRTCNTQKQRMSPELWARRCGCWAQWRENQNRMPDSLSLF